MSEEETKAPEEQAPAPERFGTKLFDQARKAKERAAELASKATELKDQATTRAGELKDQAAARATELKDAGMSRVMETIGEFNDALPAVREAGYALVAVEIQIGIPPRVVAKFSALSEISDDRVEALLAEHAEKKFTVLLLKALFQASRFQSKVHVAGLKPAGLDVEIGLTPHVTAKFG